MAEVAEENTSQPGKESKTFDLLKQFYKVCLKILELNPDKLLEDILGKKTFLEQVHILKASWITCDFILLETIKRFIFLVLA